MRFATITEEHPPFEFRSPHGVGNMKCQSRYWNGIAVRHVVQCLGPGRVWHDLSSKDPTVAILLEQVGGYCESRLNVNRPTPRTRFDAGHTVFVPAEMSVWGYSDGIESTRDLRLSFNANVLASILGDEFEVGKTREPVLMVYDDKIARCASLLAEECREPEARMYGESLTTALTALLFARWKHPRSEPAKGWHPGSCVGSWNSSRPTSPRTSACRNSPIWLGSPNRSSPGHSKHPLAPHRIAGSSRPESNAPRNFCSRAGHRSPTYRS